MPAPYPSTLTSSAIENVIDETIRLTVWRNIRRYILLSGISFVILDLIITLTVVLLLAAATRASDLTHAQVACRNTATIAKIEHASVAQQATETTALVKQGFTFGLPKAEFHRLVVESKAQQVHYLASLDALAKANCSTLQ